jgi:protein gp37
MTGETIPLTTHLGEPVSSSKPKGKAKFNSSPGDGISWASWSWNPVTGCLHDCEYCYARELATSAKLEPYYPAGFKPTFRPERLAAPANTSVPKGDDPALRRVFVVSMGDLYGQWVPSDWIEQVHAACAANPQWQYIFLTKNPGRYARHPPPPGAWVGASVDRQKMVRIAENAARRIDNAAVKWLSLEPMKEELRFTDLSMFDWVVIGAQTATSQPDGKGGKGKVVVPAFAPPFEWVARIVAQAREAGLPVHMKPNLLGAVGPRSPGMTLLNEFPEARLAQAPH